MQSFIIGIGGVIVLMLGWVVVQCYWGKSFSEEISDEDVLADRRSCSNCGCSIPCNNALRQ